jgi:dienelactone hydrolase
VREEQILFYNAGQRINGVLHLPEQPVPAPGVVLLHGFFGSHIEVHRLMVTAARTLAASGLVALRISFRGLGDSEGDTCEMTVAGEISDAQAALSFLEQRPEVDPAHLGALGISLGGCVAACLAGVDARVQALVLWAPTALLHLGQAGSVMPPDIWPQIEAHGWADRRGNRVGRAFYEGLPDVRPLEKARGYHGPALIIHGTADSTVTREDCDAYLAHLGGSRAYVGVEGADHEFSSWPWTTQLVETSARWLAKHL